MKTEIIWKYVSEKKEGEKEELLRGKVFQMVVRFTMVLYTWKRGKKGKCYLKRKCFNPFIPVITLGMVSLLLTGVLT